MAAYPFSFDVVILSIFRIHNGYPFSGKAIVSEITTNCSRFVLTFSICVKDLKYVPITLPLLALGWPDHFGTLLPYWRALVSSS